MEHKPEFLKLVNDSKKNIKEVTVDEVQTKFNDNTDFLLIDVREESEWNNDHIAGAMYMGRGIIERDIERIVPDASREIVLYCGGGYRSALSAESLQKMGYTKVFSLAGGWKAWLDAGYETEKQPKSGF